ncbi:MAG: amino acid adenylation domain-containing protein [Terriglobia bacterium]
MARTQPEASFLISPETGRVLTFQGLQEQSRFLSTQLREAGLERGDKVAFLLENGLFTAQLFLGAMYGGFVSVPLNVRAGVSQLSYMLDHCDAKVVFVADEYATMMAEVMAQVRRTVQAIPADIDGFPAAGETPPSATSLPVPGPEDQALLMYTSGSTGHPKAAVHSHRTVLSFAANSVRSHQLAGADRSLLMLPLYHINASCVTLVPTLMTGGCVVVPHRFSVSQFWDWLDEHRCTWSAVVPTIIAQLLEWEDPRADKRQAAFQRIRFVRSSSAPLAPSLHREFLDKFPLLLIQAMGSSEAGNVFSNPLPPGKNKIGSPGLPWGFEVKIVDREGVELAAGEPGEIVLRGPAVMQGYYKEPEATAAVLDPDGWLHTGDLAYRDEDGYFFVVGRSKELIIKGGVNIAPRQIDDVLESHPAVREAAAVGVPDRYLGEDLVAFVVLRAGVACEERELLAFCESRLGHFKTPTRIHFADDLPKGPSGKVQRLHLRDEAAQLATGSSGSSRGELAIALGTGQVAHPGLPAAGSSIEQIIAETWTEVLSKAPVDAESNFFALGGHSLLAMQCVSRLRERIPVALSLSDFFENATVAQQAALVRRRLPRDEGQALAGGSAAAREEAWQLKVASSVSPLAIPPRDPALPCPLSTAQRRLWFIEQLNPGLPLYNEAEGVRLLGELNTEAMERALNVIVARHEVLRTTIQVTDNEPVMVVHESWPLQLKKIDLSALTPAERQAEVERLLIDEPRRLYHLEAEPGIRATLLRLAPREHIFILMMHHIFSDRSSLGILFREMATLYRAFCRGESIALPPLLIQYGDYAVWQQQRITDAASAEDLSFWTENLRGAPQLLELPADRPRPLTLSYRGVKRRFRLNPALTKALRDASQREKASLFTLFTAALDTLLYRYTGREDILLGIPIADRERPELQSVIGFLVHTCVLRTGLSGDMTFRELLALVQKEMLELYRHRAVPFDEVVRKLRPERNPSYSPLFQVMINWRDRGLQLSFIGLEGLVVEPLLAQSETAKLDLQLFITDGGDEFWLEMEYSTDLFDEARISRMIGHYQTLLESVASDPGRRLAELPLLTAEERRQLLVEWNNTRVDYPADACVHELFERQAKRTPEAVAVEFNGERLTYSELNRRSTEFAQHLQARGVGPDVLVAVYVDRSLELVIALLGILKAGGAYLPVDLVFPQERVAFMLGDAQPRVLVTVTKLLAELPRNQSEVVCVNDFAALSEAPMARPPESRHLAYVIYTSGSTGKPKGVEICHRAVVNFLNSMRQVPGMEAQDTLLSVTSPSFDIFGLELWLPLTSGAKVVIVSQDVAMDGSQLAKVMAARGVTVMQATPSTWRVLLEAGWEGDLSLKILCGGEAWPEELAAQLLPKGRALWNMYGPTETTLGSAVYPVEKGTPILIGDPIANTQFYVVDSDLQPVPVGVPGELLIGGDGLARGYLRRPELTAEKFIPDPFSASAGSRLYRTGDLVRYLPDGNLEFLGRLDQQVKIHGFRIELGEIEAALRQHPAVQQTVVIAREDTPGDKRLVAYVVVNPEYEIGSDEAESHSEHLDGWQTMWDETYQQSAEIPDHTFNIAGWNSSYTGEAIPAEQMRTWVDTTVERILALRPQRVWEIGCGTGLLLHRLAPHCLHYYATDFSATAVNTLQRQIAGSAVTNKVVLKQAQAHDFTGIEAGSFDVVILNSVAQYFPDVNYLVRVLEGAVRAVKPGGAIFLGDIRSEPLLNAFHAAVQLEQAPASLPGADLRQRIQRALSQESELAISPGFFIALWKHLPAITQVEIQLKRGRHHNELSLFRYDVVLRVGATVKSTENQTRFDWQQRGFSVPDLRRYLEEERPAALTLTGVPNARLQREFKLLEILAGVECPATVGELRGALRADSAPNAIDPEDLWTLGESLGYTVQVRWSDGGAAASCDAVFLRRENGAGDGVDSVFHFPGEPSASRPWSAYANNPLQRALISNLTPRLSSYLQESLPDYMVPSAFVTLGTLPLTPNGKVDRRALPPPAAERLAGAISADLVPQNETERKIAAIWQDVLGITSVGREDNFFDLGGDSFRLIRVRNHLQRTFGKDIPLVDMFRCTTVRALAQYFAGRPAELTAPDHTQEELEARRGASRRHRQLRRLLVDELREHLNE